MPGYPSIEHRSEKILLLTWHDSSAPTKEPIYDSVTPRSLPQHDSSTPFKDSVCESVTPRCMPHCMLTPHTDESVITDTQFILQQAFEETKLDGEVGFGDVAGNGIDSSGLSHDESFRVDDLDLNLNEPVDLNVSQTETQSKLPVSEEPDVGTDNDDEDDDFLVDEENEIVEPDVDVHLFGIIMDVPFDNIGVTNLVLDDVIEGKDVDVINPDGFDSDPGNDNETSYYGRRRQKFNTTKEAKDIVYLNSIKSRRNLKLYKNDSVTVRARCDRKVHVFTMSQGTGPTSLNQVIEVRPSGSSGPTIRSKKRKNTCTNDDSQACSSTLDAHDKGDLCLNIFNQVRVNLKIPVKAVQDQLRHDLELQKTMRKAFRAKAKAEREIRGDHVLQYSMLREYVL
ncbi:hypothetical protein Tco_0377332 [Tanacetum coccineum]